MAGYAAIRQTSRYISHGFPRDESCWLDQIRFIIGVQKSMADRDVRQVDQAAQIKAFHGYPEDGIQTQIWIGVAVYALVATSDDAVFVILRFGPASQPAPPPVGASRCGHGRNPRSRQPAF